MVKDNQKGVSVYITIIMLSILLAVSLGLAGIITGAAKMVGSLSNAVIAFHAADTGIEQALYQIKSSAGATCTNINGTCGTDCSYAVTITKTGATCADAGTEIKSLGTYKTTKRKVEAAY